MSRYQRDEVVSAAAVEVRAVERELKDLKMRHRNRARQLYKNATRAGTPPKQARREIAKLRLRQYVDRVHLNDKAKTMRSAFDQLRAERREVWDKLNPADGRSPMPQADSIRRGPARATGASAQAAERRSSMTKQQWVDRQGGA